MKTLAAIFLLILIVYNLRIASFRIYKVKPKLYIFIIGILISLTFFYLWLNFQGFILGLLAIGLFFYLYSMSRYKRIWVSCVFRNYANP